MTRPDLPVAACPTAEDHSVPDASPLVWFGEPWVWCEEGGVTGSVGMRMPGECLGFESARSTVVNDADDDGDNQPAEGSTTVGSRCCSGDSIPKRPLY